MLPRRTPAREKRRRASHPGRAQSLQAAALQSASETQSLNVWRGGTLIQHLAPMPVNHPAGKTRRHRPHRGRRSQIAARRDRRRKTKTAGGAGDPNPAGA